MRRLLFPVLLAACPASAEPISGDACRSLAMAVTAVVPDFTVEPPANISSGPAGCIFRNWVWRGTSRYGPNLEIGRVGIGGTGLGAFASGGPPPTDIEVSVDDLRLVVRVGEATQDYVFQAQSVRNAISGTLAAQWTAADRRLTLDRLSVDFPGDNALFVTATASGVDLSSRIAAIGSVAGVQLDSWRVDLTSHGFFEFYILPTVATLIPDVDAAIDLARDRITAAPGGALPAQSKAALASLLDDLPNPNGSIRITGTHPDGFGMADVLALSRLPTDAALDALADRARVTVSYTRSGTGR